jgi:phosphocarrier protein
MAEFTYVLKNKLGLHARPAGQFVREAKKYKSSVSLELNGNSVDAKRGVINVMRLSAKCGDEMKISASGEDSPQAVAELKTFFEANNF